MGLGFSIVAETPKRGILRKVVSPKRLFRDFGRALSSRLENHPLRPFFRIDVGESACDFTIYPAEEPLNLSVEEGRLVLSAKTSSTGPGYHRFLIELIEEVSNDLAIEWAWANADDDIGDETGYYESRDFEHLQAENARWLRALARSICGEPDMAGVNLVLPFDFRVQGSHFAASPRGFWKREYFEALIDAGDDEMSMLAPRFFPWWGRDTDQQFWDGLGDVLCWSLVPWHVPLEDHERNLMLATVDVLSKTSVPSDPELRELQALLSEDHDHTLPPKPEGRGFLRRMMRHLFGEGWTVELPGYYYHEPEDEPGTEVFWFADRTVFLSAYFASGVSRENALGDRFDAPDGGETYVFENEDLLGRGHISEREEDGERRYMLDAGVATSERLAHVTICFGSAADREWALETWRSVR